MAMRDEIRKERQAFLASATRKEKWNYILEYYRLQIVVGLIVLIAVVYFIAHAIMDPDVILDGVFINLYEHEQTTNTTELGRQFLNDEEFGTSKYDVSFGSGISLIKGEDAANYQSAQALMVQAAAGTLDFIVGPYDVLLEYAYGGLFVDLSTVLTEEELEAYQPYLHYIDGAVVTLRKQAEDNFESVDTIPMPDSTKPEEMKEPIPVFVDMASSEKLAELYGPYTKNLIYGFTIKSAHPENAVIFLKYLLK